MAIVKEIKKIFFDGTAVYISADFIDIAEAHMSPGGVTLTSLQRFPIGSGPERGIDAILDRVFASEDQVPYRIAVNVKNDQLILRQFTMRELPSKERIQAVAFEAQQHLPCPVDTLTYGFKTYQKMPHLREIIFAAVDTKNINELVSYFERRHIIPAVIEPVPLLMSKLVSLNDPKSKGASILLHYEPHGKIILCGISQNYPYFFREIIVSSGIGPKWKEEKNDAYPSLGAVWPHIKEDVVMSMNYLHKESGDSAEKMYISGFSRSQDEEKIAKELTIPIERHRFPFFTKEDSEKDDRYLPILMLILDSLKSPSLNIAPAEVVRRDMRPVKSVFLKFLAGAAAIMMLHFVFVGVNAGMRLRASNEAKRFQSHGDVNLLSSAEEVEQYKKSVIDSVSFAEDLLSKKVFLVRKLAALSRLMPPISWIESVSVKRQTDEGESLSVTLKGMIFEGAAPDSVSANAILEKLKADKEMMKGLTLADLSYVEKKIAHGREVTEFEISFK